jgi:hypothetical protein
MPSTCVFLIGPAVQLQSHEALQAHKRSLDIDKSGKAANSLLKLHLSLKKIIISFGSVNMVIEMRHTHKEVPRRDSLPNVCLSLLSVSYSPPSTPN